MRSASSVWSAVNAEALAEIAASRWRRWPTHVPLETLFDRTVALARARELASAQGAGHVIELALTPERFASVRERPLDASELPDCTTAAIMESAGYRGAVAETEIARAESLLQMRFPAAWRSFLRRDAWFRRGDMDDAYVRLNGAIESAEETEVITEFPGREGMIAIGGDGSREILVLDGRTSGSPVYLMDTTGDWDAAIEQAPTVDEFLARIDAGTFDFVFGE